jgi:hypothetical protein
MKLESWDDAVRKAEAEAAEREAAGYQGDPAHSTTVRIMLRWLASVTAMAGLGAIFVLALRGNFSTQPDQATESFRDQLMRDGAKWTGSFRVGLTSDGASSSETAYKILDQQEDDAAVTLHVQLFRKPTVDALHSLCEQLRAAHRGNRPRTVIWFALPGHRCPQEAWARADFDPKLTVEVLGFTIEQEKSLLAQPLPSSDELLGVWLSDSLNAARHVIYRKNGRYWREDMNKDGGTTEELFEHGDDRGRCFSPMRPSSHDDQYLIRMDGVLQVRDKDGLIDTGLPVVSDGDRR